MVNPYASLATGGPLFDAQAAIAARLLLAFPAPRFNHEILPAAMTPAMWTELARRTPMVALGFMGLRASAQSGRMFEARAEWRVVPVLRNGAGPRARLLGDKQGPGQLGVLQVAVAALHGMTIAGAGTVEVADATNLYAEGWADEHAALSGITVAVRFALQPAPAAGAVDEFLRHAADWAFTETGAPAAAQTINLREEA